VNEIADVLHVSSEEGSENILTLEDVKDWLPKYLQMHEEDAVRFPAERNRSHWDMIIADYDSKRDAMFILAFFDGNSATFIGGRGSSSAVRDFGDNSFPRDPNDVPDEISRRFWVGGRATVNLNDLLHWLEQRK
jgi:hypothetical protein